MSSAWDFTLHSGQYRVRVVPEGRGYRAKLISVGGIGTIMEPHGNSPTEALISLARELYDTESVFERKLAKDIVRHTALPIVLGSPARSAQSHSTKKQSDERFWIAPAEDPRDRYAAGYDGNHFRTRREAQRAIASLRSHGGEFDAPWVINED